MERTTPTTAGPVVTTDYSIETEKNSDTTDTDARECLSCGSSVFKHYRDLRGRAQWECVSCGSILETPLNRSETA